MPPEPGDPTPEWQPFNLMNHFNEHRRELSYADFREYEAGSLTAISTGRRFTFRDPKSGRLRIGYYDPSNGHLTVVDRTHTEIITHYRASERYVRNLPASPY